MHRRARPAFLLATLLLGGAARPAHRTAPTPARTAPATGAPAAYRATVSAVGNCADFVRLAPTLPDATPLLRAMFAEGLPQKSAAETDQTFMDRVIRRLFAQLGDPARLHTAVPVEGARYDARTGTIALAFPQPYSVTLDTWDRSRLQIRGVAAAVRTATSLRAEFDFAPGALPPSLQLAVKPDAAARFATGGGRLHILSVFEDMGTDASHASATADRPEAEQTSYRLVRLKPKCAIVTDGAALVAGWQLDAWDAATQ